MTHDLAIINTFVLYIGFMMAIGVYYYRRTRNMSDYFLGNRKLGAWVTSLSAEASDMSGWMLMGVPGYAYLAGLNAGWIAIGIAIGTWANWHFVAARLRKYTELANNSLTLPEFLQNRFHDKSGLLRIVPAIFILIFFVIYTSSGFVWAASSRRSSASPMSTPSSSVPAPSSSTRSSAASSPSRARTSSRAS